MVVCRFICVVITLFIVLQEITGEQCKPGETKMKDCNHCRCVADGKGFACTRRFCFPQERQIGHRVRRQGECYPGQVRNIDCNTCRCVRGGAWACTRRACLKPRYKRELSVAPDLLTTPCAPNDYFQLDCNRCYCKDDRSGYLCTQNFCSYDDASTSTTTTTTTTEKVVANVIGETRGSAVVETTTTEDVETTTFNT